MTTLVETALEKAHAILGSECSPIGLMASPEGYPHVWARDSVITSLGAILSPGHENCLRVSLATLAGQQSELGAIPEQRERGDGAAGSHQRRLGGLEPVVHPGPLYPTPRLWRCRVLARVLAVAGTRAAVAALPGLERLRPAWKSTRPPIGPTCWPIASTSCTTMRCGMPRCARWRRWRSASARRMARDYDEMARDVRHKMRIVLWVGPESRRRMGAELSRPHRMEAHAQPGGSGAGQATFLFALRGLSRFRRLLRCVRQPADDPVRHRQSRARKTHPGLSAPGRHRRAVSGACAASGHSSWATRTGANTTATTT